MDVVDSALLAALGCACALCVAGVWALIDLVKTSRSVRLSSDELRARLIPLTEKLDVTVDAFNAELLRVDGIITRFEDTSVRMSDASARVSGIVNTPAEIVSEAAARVRRALWERKHHNAAPASADPDEPANHMNPE